MPKSGQEVANKLQEITGIRERRYIPENEDSVPLMQEAANNALTSAGINHDDLDGIIVAHNAGNMVPGVDGFHPVPNLAARLKNALQIANHQMFAYDILFGCPGWIQGLIQAHQAIQTGDAQHILVVGLEVASRMLDPHDVDSMIFADGCGAAVISAGSDPVSGILSYQTYSHGGEDLCSIYLDKSNKPELAGDTYVKMNGRDVYRYATTWLPKVIKTAMDKAEVSIADIDMFLFHQANGKMLQAIARNIADMEESEVDFSGKIPMTIQTLGNTSVATVPTMLDMISRGKMEDYTLQKGSLVVMASVGAGMHCNALIYRF